MLILYISAKMLIANVFNTYLQYLHRTSLWFYKNKKNTTSIKLDYNAEHNSKYAFHLLRLLTFTI